MTLDGLLAIIGIIVAIYALARPIQHQSIMLFVPWWVVPTAVAMSCLILLSLDGLDAWNVPVCPVVTFVAKTVTFVLPVAAGIWAVCRWHSARLSAKRDSLFRQFLLTSLREGTFDEAVRILTRNRKHLAKTLTEDTAALVFDRQFVRAMVSARSWLHLELLTDEALLARLLNHHRAVYCTIRELLAAEDSPLRTSALLEEGGDETIGCTDEEMALIKRTFLNPAWYHRCRVGYPLVISACARIDSGQLNEAYNRADALYGARQGITPRSRCPIFLAIKTVAHALKASIKQNSGTKEDMHRDAVDLWDIFRAILEHSVYRKETWDEPFGYGDYPTPFGFLLAEILSDYYFVCQEAWHASRYGQNPPPEILGLIVRMWAFCVMWFTKDEGHVSPRFRRSSVYRLLEMTLERRQAEIHAKEHQDAKAAWTRVFVENIKDGMTSWLPDSRHYLAEVLCGMDVCIEHIGENRDWLRQELELDATGGAIP